MQTLLLCDAVLGNYLTVLNDDTIYFTSSVGVSGFGAEYYRQSGLVGRNTLLVLVFSFFFCAWGLDMAWKILMEIVFKVFFCVCLSASRKSRWNRKHDERNFQRGLCSQISVCDSLTDSQYQRKCVQTFDCCCTHCMFTLRFPFSHVHFWLFGALKC